MGEVRFADVTGLSARALIEAYRRRSLSPVEVIRAMLEGIAAIDPAINAFIHVDRSGALAAAAESEARWRDGRPAGLLDGVPTAVKDGIAMRGHPIYRGSAASQPALLDFDAPAVARLREHGAVLLGKTTMCDYGMLASGYSSRFGPTRNPWSPAHNPGGSSSGSSAAVAAGIGPLTVGTDIVGSVRVPAAFCGLVGHKPSFGRVPYLPQTSPALVAGPIAREIEDALILMTVLCGADGRDHTALPRDGVAYHELRPAELAGTRVGLLAAIGFGTPPDPAVVAAVTRAARVFEALGADVSPLDPPFAAGEDACAADFYRVRALTEFVNLPEDLQRRAAVIDRWTAPARRLDAVAFFRSFLGTQALRTRMVAVTRPYDFLLLPTVPVPPFAAELPAPDPDDIFAAWANTFVFNLTEQPAVSVNCGFTADGLPIGLQIVGARHDDVGVLRAAFAFEAAKPGECRRPWPRLAPAAA